MTCDEAQRLALGEINKYKGEYELVIVDADTIETAYGWIFFYQTKLFLETGNFLYALGGNGPVIVERSNGRVSTLGTGRPLEEMLFEFEEKHELVR